MSKDKMPIKTTCYDNWGKEIPCDSKYIYAKKIEDERGSIFFALMTRSGDFYDPIGMYNIPNEHTKKVNGAAVYELRKVNASVFDNYVSYLKTRKKQWLTIAKRNSDGS